MRKWLTRNRETIIPLLIVLIVLLIVAILIKHQFFTLSGLAVNKDALAALSSALSIIVLSVGGLFSYYRFFKGRTFYARAELTILITIIDTPEDFNIYAVTLIIKNIGTLSIWDPTPVIKIYEQGPGGTTSQIWDNWLESAIPDNEEEMLAVIDSGESASFFNQHRVRKDIWGVHYAAFIRSHSGDVWKQSVTIANKPDKVDE